MSAGLPAWVADDRLARAAWTRLAEPGDTVAGAALAVLGPADALSCLLRGTALPARVADALDAGPGARRLELAVRRWRTRVPQLAPERDVETVRRFGGRVVVPEDDEWPQQLEGLGLTSPAALWVLGRPQLGRVLHRSLAVVGARACTAYGQHVAADIAAGAGDHGVTVMSGAAFGIDAAAHRGTLAAGGTTVAVLACGVDRFYPRAHEDLLRAIAAEGLVLAEVPPGSTPMRGRFLQRNRLIAALTSATVVVEAAWRSGALATASHAAGLGRGLGAVPGPVTSAASAGCHRLMREHAAVCVTDAQEALELVEPLGSHVPEDRVCGEAVHDGLGETDLRVLDALPVRRGVSVISLEAVAGLPRQTVQSALARLHLAGLATVVHADGERLWRRASPT